MGFNSGFKGLIDMSSSKTYGELYGSISNQR